MKLERKDVEINSEWMEIRDGIWNFYIEERFDINQYFNVSIEKRDQISINFYADYNLKKDQWKFSYIIKHFCLMKDDIEVDCTDSIAEDDKLLLIDMICEKLFYDLSDVPFDEEDQTYQLVLENDWFIFSKGTDREDIWKWFDKYHSKGVYYLLYEK